MLILLHYDDHQAIAGGLPEIRYAYLFEGNATLI